MEGFTRVGGQRKYIKYSECKPGQVLIDGLIYVGTEKNKMFDNLLHVFRDKSGSEICLNGARSLDRTIASNFNTGDRAQIVYLGLETIKSGSKAGKEAHGFEIYRAAEGPAPTPAAPKCADEFGADISL
jgi:hypothetical protein